ncbi:MAG: hypothetical protein AB1545_15645 [Thermodesulfobacteriota bacterium]
MTKRDLKIITGTLTVVGIIMAVLEQYFAPDYLTFGSSPLGKPWFIWLKLAITSLAPIAYIIVDVFEHKKGNMEKRHEKY